MMHRYSTCVCKYAPCYCKCVPLVDYSYARALIFKLESELNKLDRRCASLSDKNEDLRWDVKVLKNKVATMEAYEDIKRECRKLDRCGSKKVVIVDNDEFDDWREKTLILTRGRAWDDDVRLCDWLRDTLGEGRYVIRNAETSNDVVTVEFDCRDRKKKLWALRDALKCKALMEMDEFLTIEERLARFNLYEEARKIEGWAKSEGLELDIVKEDKRVKIGNHWYRWNPDKGRKERIREGEW